MRKIIHIDMDSFFAAIEERDDPRLKGKPVAVGGDAESRGVICTANYQARAFGVHSAMSTAMAQRLCPNLVVVFPDMEKYQAVSKNIQQIFQQYTNLVEPLSLDEAFLDVSNCTKCYASATWIAQEIRNKIYASEKLTASAGVSINKFLAKVASDWHKPNGQYVVPPEQVADFVAKLPVTKIFGVGPKAAAKLHRLGLEICQDLQNISLTELTILFGNKFGYNLFNLCRGIDDREIRANTVRKSISVEHTFIKDIKTLTQCKFEIPKLLDELQQRITANANRPYHKVFIKIKFFDFTHTTVEAVTEKLQLAQINHLLTIGFARGNNKAVRLLGLGVRFKENNKLVENYDTISSVLPLKLEQMSLF